MKYITSIGEQEYLIEIVDEHHVLVNENMYEVDFESVSGHPVHSLLVDGKSFEAYVSPREEDWQVLLHGDLYNVRVQDERERRLRAASGGLIAERSEFHLKAPMPGLIVDVPVKAGQSVEKGDVLVILESMKMQNELRSPREGTVIRIRVQAGDSVDQKQTLLSVE